MGYKNKVNIQSILEIKKATCICYGVQDTIYGKMVLFYTAEGIYGLHFLIGPLADYLGLAKKKFKKAVFLQDQQGALHWWDKVRAGGCVNLVLQGTPFQQKVWRVLCDIPMGGLTTYEALAMALGMGTGSSRAVARAIAQNFIALFVPCHRVVRKDASIGGYRWGVNNKRMLIAHEASIANLQELACRKVHRPA
ncbi:MAG: methylated-DNA--[protein]-cysteine S-methyltransferase [Bacteroidota bacterium]